MMQQLNYAMLSQMSFQVFQVVQLRRSMKGQGGVCALCTICMMDTINVAITVKIGQNRWPKMIDQ